jgi:hypothetical protein
MGLKRTTELRRETRYSYRFSIKFGGEWRPLNLFLSPNVPLVPVWCMHYIPLTVVLVS